MALIQAADFIAYFLKPAKILIGNAGEGKLSDFGLALPTIQGLSIAQLKPYQYVLHLAPEVRSIQDYANEKKPFRAKSGMSFSFHINRLRLQAVSLVMGILK